MKKRGLAVVLALALAAGLCGCVEKKAEATPVPSPTPAATPTSLPTPSATAPVISKEGFLPFLTGDTEATVDEDFYDDLSFVCGGVFPEVQRFDLPTLTKLAVDSFANAVDHVDIEVSYALLETSGGREMLAVQYFCPVGVEMFRGDFIFGLYDGEVRLTYAVDSWNRSDTRLCQGLIFDGEGADGAGDYHEWLGYIDDTGHYRRVYFLETLYSAWVAMRAHKVFDWKLDWAAGYICKILTTEEGDFYALEVPEGTDEKNLERFRAYMEDEGKQEVPEVDTMIADLKEAHGLGDAIPFEDWLQWPPEVCVNTTVEWLDEGLWEELTQRQQELLSDLPAKELPKEAAEWRETREVWENTLVPMCYDEKNDVTVYTVTEENSVAEFQDGGYWYNAGIVLRVGEKTKYYPIGHCQGWTGSNPLMVVKDFDGDGKDEAAVSFFSGHGTGVGVSILYIFDLETLEYETMDFSGVTLRVQYDPEGSAATLESGDEKVRVTLPECPEDWTYLNACIGNVVQYEEKEGKLFCTLAVDFSGRTLWYLATAAGEVVYENGRYTLGPLTLEATE